MWRIDNRDVLKWAATYNGPKFHAMLCDPPYELAFMSREWDVTGIAFDKGTWAALAQHLHPGAFIMAFAGTRGYHRMACAMEDAGLIIHPAIGWAFGSGFPKATRIDTQVDKAAGAVREVVGANPNARPNSGRTGGIMGEAIGAVFNTELTAPASPLARAWAGHRYGLQALKPAFEFIAVAQKPYAGKPVDCITGTGAGALNIELGRIKQKAQQPDDGAYTLRVLLSLLDAGDIRPFSEQSCRDFLLQISFALDCGSNFHTYLKRSEGAQDDIGRHRALYGILSSRLYPSGVWCGLNLSEVANSLDGCQSCRRLYDELLLRVLNCAQEGSPSLAGVLSDICREKPLPSHSLCSGSDHLYNSLFNFLSQNIIARIVPPVNNGRWPANLILSHSPDCGETCAEDCAVKMVGEQGEAAGVHSAGSAQGYQEKWARDDDPDWIFGGVGKGPSGARIGDTGTAARFFFNADHTLERIEAADPLFYCAKAGRAERDAGLEHLPIIDGADLSGGGGLNSEKADAYQARKTRRHNPHPTVKPLKLTQHLATLLLPPTDYAPRRLLVPFSGSGSEMAGALLSGWEEVQGVELESEYAAIAAARLEYWTKHAGELATVTKGEQAEEVTNWPKCETTPAQPALF